MKSIKITILNDNHCGRLCGSEHGLSYLLDIDGKKILFDLGPSDIFMRNAEKLNINLNHVDAIVLSHGHWDHGNGLSATRSGFSLAHKKLITHPDSFTVRYRKSDRKPIGLPLSYEEAKRRYNITLSKEPFWVSENLLFLGEIPRENDFEGKSTTFFNEERIEDFVADDSAVVARTPHGLVVVCGCSHAGVCNTIEYARKVTGVEKVYAVLGGFHLKYVDDQLANTIDYFKTLHVEHLYPSHCTSFDVQYVFKQNFNSGQILTGEILEF